MGKFSWGCACVSLALFLTASSSSYIWADRWEVQISGGGWSLSPFTSPVERKSEEMIREEYSRLLNLFLIDQDIIRNAFQVNLGSSGKHLALAAWYHFGPDRFSIGLRGRYFHYRIPYDVYSRQVVNFLGFSMAELETQGSGQVELGSIMVSLLGRCKVLDAGKLKMSLYGGLAALPFDGKLNIEGSTVLKTPVGEFEYAGAEEHLIKRVRAWNEKVPSLILSPALGCFLQYNLIPQMGLILDASLSHGTAYSAGIAFNL
jgi:hypothetical protein